MADIGDQAWIVVLAYAAAQSGDPLVATLTVAAGTIPRAILDLVGGAIADRLPTRPVLVGAAFLRVLVLVLGVLALINYPKHTIAIMVVVAAFFGAADALHKPAVGTMPRQLVPVGQLVQAAGLRQLINRTALLVGPALAGLVLAAWALVGAMAGLIAVFAAAAILLSMVRTRYRRELAPRQSVIASTRQVIGYLRGDSTARALTLTMIGLNFFVIPVINAGIALRAHEQGWGAHVLGVLIASVGVGAIVGTMTALLLRPRYPMRFALVLLVGQGFALALSAVLPQVGSAISLGLVGVTAGLSSPMLGGTTQTIVPESYIGRIYALFALADDALIPFALVGYGICARAIGVEATTVICGLAMAALMGIGLLRTSLRNLQLSDHESAGDAADSATDTEQPPADERSTQPTRDQTSGGAGSVADSPSPRISNAAG